MSKIQSNRVESSKLENQQIQLCGKEKKLICNLVIAVAFELKCFEWPTLELNKKRKRRAGRGKKNEPMSRATDMVLNERLFPDLSNIPEPPSTLPKEATKKRKRIVRDENLNE